MKRCLTCLMLLVACSSRAALVDVRFELPARTVVFHAEVARTADEQQRGLMGRASLPPDRGMLFVWRDVEVRHFFMKNTLIPLDLVSIRGGRVVGLQRMTPCHAEPCPLTPTPPADAALELNDGAAERAGITLGALVDSPPLD